MNALLILNPFLLSTVFLANLAKKMRGTNLSTHIRRLRAIVFKNKIPTEDGGRADRSD